MYESNKIAKIIKSFAESRKIQLKDMLIDLNLNKNTLSNMYKGSSLKSDSLAMIADYLDCSVDYLLGRTDDPNLYFLDGSRIKNNPNLMKMYKLLPVYPSADYVLPRVRFLSPEQIKEAVIRRNENVEKADFIVQSSRMEPVYCDGDYLLIEKTDHINIGEIGIFVIGKQAYIVKKENDSLIFPNPYFPPIQINDNVYCAGRVIGPIDSSALFFTAMD